MPNTVSHSSSSIYDASDLSDVYSLAEYDLKWMQTALIHIQEQINKLSTSAKNKETILENHFSAILIHLEMYEFIAEKRIAYYLKETERYAQEWEATHRGVK